MGDGFLGVFVDFVDVYSVVFLFVVFMKVYVVGDGG